MTQLPLFRPNLPWTPPDLSTLPSWAGARRVAVDCETKDPTLLELGPGVRRGGKIVGLSFRIEDGPPAMYLPIRHAGGDNLPVDRVLQYFRDQAVGFAGQLVGMNLLYDLDFMAEEGIVYPKVSRFRDVAVAEPILDELQMSYTLEAISARNDLPGKDSEDLDRALEAWGLKNGRGDIWRLPGRFAAKYGARDVDCPLELLRRQERRLEAEDLWGTWELESRLIPVLLKMRRRGIRFSHERLRGVEHWSIETEAALLAEIRRNTGVSLTSDDINSSSRCARLFAHLGIRLPQTKDGKPSVTKAVMESCKDPNIALLHRARQVNKVRTTFVASVRAHAIGDRLHCTLNQLRRAKEGMDEDEEGGGAITGRLSSQDPNMQQQPGRDDEIGPMWRSIYLPEEGAVWVSADFSQQEPRLIVHYSELTGCRGGKEAGQRFREDPKMDFHAMMSELTGQKRKDAKINFLGRCYGMGGVKLCRKLGLPTVTAWSNRLERYVDRPGPEGQAIINQFDARAPFVAELARKAENKAKRDGFLVTVGGRKLHFPADGRGGWADTHKALNKLIQGSAADQTKKATLDADDAGAYLQLQVHDELDGSAESPEQARRLFGEPMERSVPLLVPNKVDVETGPSWGEAK